MVHNFVSGGDSQDHFIPRMFKGRRSSDWVGFPASVLNSALLPVQLIAAAGKDPKAIDLFGYSIAIAVTGIGTFFSKHRKGNKQGEKEYFIKETVYRLIDA